MRWWIRFGGRPITAFLIAFVATLALFANAQTISERVSGPDQDAIRAIAGTLAPIPDRADAVLKSVGFSKMAQSLPQFSEWPAVRKIETAYLSAVEAGGAPEGEKFLLVVSRVIAEDHSNAVRHESSLKPYFSDQSAIDRGGIRFAPISIEPAPPTNPATRAAILAIERYVERVPGGMQSALRVCCGYDPAAVYDILRASPSRFHAMIRAVEMSHLPPELRDRLLRLVKAIAESSHAVVNEPELKPYLQALAPKPGEPSGLVPAQPALPIASSWTAENQGEIEGIVRGAAKKADVDDPGATQLIALMSAPHNNGSPPSTPPSPYGQAPKPPPGPSSPSLAGSPELPLPPGSPKGTAVPPDGGSSSPFLAASDTTNANLARYNQVQASVGEGGFGIPILPSSSPGKPTFGFETMRLSGKGFGGVVFGAPLDISHIPKPTAVSWVPDFSTSDRVPQWGHFDVVLTDGTVVMTRRMHSDDAYAAWEIVNGRSGVFPALNVVDWEGVGLASVGPNHVMVVHPALYGFEIGDAAILADAIGFKMSEEAFRQRISLAGATSALVQKATTWLTAENGFYKIIDAPLRIEVRDGLVRAERTEADGYPKNLREVGFLRFQAIDEERDQQPSERETPFYEILPALITAFPAFERLNSFAETFAIMRWAKLSGAEVKPPPSSPKRGDAKLYVSRLPSGEVFQSDHSLSSRERAAVDLEDIRRMTEATLSILKAAGAPSDALQRVAEVGGQRKEEIRLAVADEELGSISHSGSEAASQATAVSTKLSDRYDEIEDALHLFSTKVGILIALAGPSDAAALRDLQDHLQVAKNALAESEHDLALVEEAQSLENRVAALPTARRRTVQGIYQKLLKQQQTYDDANTERQKQAAKLMVVNTQKTLEKMLPPIDQGKSKATSNLVKERIRDRDKAQSAFDEAVSLRTPSWLDTTWHAIRNLAVGSYDYPL